MADDNKEKRPMEADQFGGFDRDPRGPCDRFADEIKKLAGIPVKTPRYRHEDK